MISVNLTELTRELATEALRLHRLALAAEDVQDLRSPATGSRSDDGISRPTEDTVMCPRRALVIDTVNEVRASLAEASPRLSHALDVWQGVQAP